MTNGDTGAPAATAAAAAAVDTVEAPAQADASTVSTTAAPISKWPWWGTLLVSLALLAGLFIFQGLLWAYVRSTDEIPEKDDFDQLKSIADNIQEIVLLLVGAIFGIGATQGVVAGAAKAADDNKKSAEKANDTANENAVAAKTNLDRADRFESATKSLATAITDLKRVRRSDDTRHIANFQTLTRSNGFIQLQDSDFLQYDTELDRMTADCERILARLR